MRLDIFFKENKQIGYFRKVNFLVKYFSDLGLDVEHQTPLSISKEDIEVLLSRCKQVLKDNSKASYLLPTMGGFFFGSTEYDSNYFEDVKEVKEYIESELLPKFDNLKSGENIIFDISY